MRTNEIKNEIDEIKNWEEKIRRKDLVKQINIKTNQYKYDFQQHDTTRSFGDNVYKGKINTDEADIDQNSLSDSLKEFNDRSKTVQGKNKKKKYI